MNQEKNSREKFLEALEKRNSVNKHVENPNKERLKVRGNSPHGKRNKMFRRKSGSN